jgi:hypothetical protein
MSRPYDDADDLQEREIYLRDQGVDHEETMSVYSEESPLTTAACWFHCHSECLKNSVMPNISCDCPCHEPENDS